MSNMSVCFCFLSGELTKCRGDWCFLVLVCVGTQCVPSVATRVVTRGATNAGPMGAELPATSEEDEEGEEEEEEGEEEDEDEEGESEEDDDE